MHQASDARYSSMPYHRCGKSGLLLPAVSLGFWHNFGDTGRYETMKQLCFTAFDHGITHFDLANNYGPEPGSAEKNLGRILHENFMPYRDELIISTKAGYTMWDGPYGDWGSRKYLLASLDQSLQRLGLDYVDIYYHHRMDPNTPLEETMGALATAVQSGKAIYAGLSNYNGETLEKATAILNELHVPFVINQNRYSIFDRTIEKNGLKETANRLGKGIIAFSPLAQGRPVSARHSGRQPGAHRRPVPEGKRPHRGKTGADPCPERDRCRPRPDPGRDGAGLDPEGRAGDQCADRCIPPGADPGQHQGAGQHHLYRRRAGGHRPRFRIQQGVSI